jgi:hypothetical protein
LILVLMRISLLISGSPFRRFHGGVNRSAFRQAVVRSPLALIVFRDT